MQALQIYDLCLLLVGIVDVLDGEFASAHRAHTSITACIKYCIIIIAL